MKFRAIISERYGLNMNRELVKAFLEGFKPGTPMSVEIKKYRKPATDSQRGLYFGHILPEFMKGLGYETTEKDLFHAQLKGLFYGIKPDRFGMYRGLPSVFGAKSKLTQEQRTEFIDGILRMAAREGVYIDIEQ